MYEVSKHPTPFGNSKWRVQMPKGIMCFPTKKRAESFATAMLNSQIANPAK